MNGYEVEMVKGSPAYETALTVFNFLKNFGNHKNEDRYWHEAMEYAKKHERDELTNRLIFTILKYFDEVQKNE